MLTNLLEAVEAAGEIAFDGRAVAILGIALCVFICGLGSSLGLYKTASAAAGVLSEAPDKYGKLVVLVLLPATQGIYGFLIGIIAAGQAQAGMALAQGWAVFMACLPMTISGFISGVYQGKAAVNCINAVGKQGSLSGKLLLFPAMIEFYAILGLVISMIMVVTL